MWRKPSTRYTNFYLCFLRGQKVQVCVGREQMHSKFHANGDSILVYDWFFQTDVKLLYNQKQQCVMWRSSWVAPCFPNLGLIEKLPKSLGPSYNFVWFLKELGNKREENHSYQFRRSAGMIVALIKWYGLGWGSWWSVKSWCSRAHPQTQRWFHQCRTDMSCPGTPCQNWASCACLSWASYRCSSRDTSSWATVQLHYIYSNQYEKHC